MESPRSRQLSRAGLGVALALALVALPSCGGSDFHAVYPVSGRILVNGEPAADCMIQLNRTFDDNHPRRVMPVAFTNEQGEFKVTSYYPDDGAPEGEYVVTIQWRERSGLMSNYEGIDRLDGAYANVEFTKTMPGFVITVERKPLQLPPFELTQSPEAKKKHEASLKRAKKTFGSSGD